jgi:hypothetical protein
MSNTLIAWAAFYPVLRAAFGGPARWRKKTRKGLIFLGFASVRLAARQAVRVLHPRPAHPKNAFSPLRFLVKTAA